MDVRSKGWTYNIQNFLTFRRFYIRRFFCIIEIADLWMERIYIYIYRYIVKWLIRRMKSFAGMIDDRKV